MTGDQQNFYLAAAAVLVVACGVGVFVILWYS
jgi:hypothetical protein